MFDNLIESKPKRERTVGQTITSVVVHLLLISAAVKLTAGAAETLSEKKKDTMDMFIKPPEPPPPPPPPEHVQQVVSQNPPPQGFQTIVPPKEIPTEIPPVNLNDKFDARDFSGKGVEGGISTGVVGGTGAVILGESFTQEQVDDQVKYLGGGDPKYPPALKAANIEGAVTLRFIVGTDGKAEPNTIQVLNSTNKAFEEPAIDAIKHSTFSPAKIKGQVVRQLVEQVVRFQIR